MKKPKPFATEVELCAVFLAALPAGWTAYAETANWDIILRRNRDGFQIGIQAKLRLNVDVICQALEERGGAWWVCDPGPNCRAVLVPEGEGRLGRIADYCGLTVIWMRSGDRHNPFYPGLPLGDRGRLMDDGWHDWAPAELCKLPAYVPDSIAGSPSPIQLTDWKISAIKIAVTLERRGYVTRADFKHLDIDHRRWVTSGWLKVVDGRFVADAPPDFKAQHPRNYAEIAADAVRWMLRLPSPAEDPKQEGLPV